MHQPIDINNSNRVVYRFYNGIVSTNNICETIAPASPTVTDQWNATAEKYKFHHGSENIK
jgi:hypothetical protein